MVERWPFEGMCHFVDCKLNFGSVSRQQTNEREREIETKKSFKMDFVFWLHKTHFFLQMITFYAPLRPIYYQISCISSWWRHKRAFPLFMCSFGNKEADIVSRSNAINATIFGKLVLHEGEIVSNEKLALMIFKWPIEKGNAATFGD